MWIFMRMISAAVVLAIPAHAQEARELAIRSAIVDPRGVALHIRGENFLDGQNEPRVHLNGYSAPLKTTRLANGSITALLPHGIESGSYVVRISRGTNPGQSGEAPVLLGIVGPAVQDD